MNLQTDISQQLTTTIDNIVNKMLGLADKRSRLQSEETLKNKNMWYCEACKEDIIKNTKTYRNKSDTHKENEVNSRRNKNLTDKPYT